MKDILQKLHDSEINWSLAAFYDGCYTAKLGDDMNGFKAEETLGSLDEAVAWLDKAAREHCPSSFYATGKMPEGWRPDGELSARHSTEEYKAG